MGMFDYIRSEIPLSDGSSAQEEYKFQTKSFDCLMDTFVISRNCEIYRETWERKWVDDETSLLGGYTKRIPESYRREYLTDLNMDVIFYGEPTSVAGWRDYHARFRDGKLVKLWHVDTQY